MEPHRDFLLLSMFPKLLNSDNDDDDDDNNDDDDDDNNDDDDEGDIWIFTSIVFLLSNMWVQFQV